MSDEEEQVVVAQVTVTPVGTGDADITDYVRRCIQVAHLSELKFQETSLGTVIRGPLDEVLKVVKRMHNAPFELGAKRVRTSVKIDDYRDEDTSTPLKTAAEAKELAIDQETFES